jgi:hypothetical protein
MSPTPLHDWLTPRLEALLREAEAAGFARDVALAVLLDLITAFPSDLSPDAPLA